MASEIKKLENEILKNGFSFHSLMEIVEYQLQCFQNGLWAFHKRLDFSENKTGFEFIVDKYGLTIYFEYMEKEAALIMFENVNLQTLTENELIKKALFFVSVIHWEKIKTVFDFETALQIVY